MDLTQRQIEEHILGSVILDNSFINDLIFGGVTREWFQSDSAKAVFDVLIALEGINEPIDEISITQELKGDLKATVTPYVLSLTDKVTSTVNNKSYIRHLTKNHKASLHADMIRKSNLMQDSGESIDEVNKFITSEIDRINSIGCDKNENELSDAFDRTIQEIDNRMNGTYKNEGCVHLPFMAEQFANPLSRGEFCILAARPSVGKSSLARQLALNAVRNNQGVLYFNLEMSSEETLKQFYSLESGVNVNNIEYTSKEKVEKLKNETVPYFKSIINKQLHLVSKTVDYREIEATFKKISASHPIDLVIVDYIQLVGSDNRLNRTDQVGIVSRRLRKIALDYNVIVVALSQFNREMEKQNRTPMLSDLRDSGSLEQDATRIWFLHRPEKTKDGVVQTKSEVTVQDVLFIQAKNRSGSTGFQSLSFIKHLTKFKSRI